jgi:hypothetical protein
VDLKAEAAIVEKEPRVVCQAGRNSQKISGGKRFEILAWAAGRTSGDGASSKESV